ncbi:hypothetical protein TWF694_002749 [Orbilia ellipsospora]|uniref:Uncharacterized protein n=1 Tax=Orbilia ellipsospora TaxID=2528407 RepID=A0AAV9X304_9PEZI
MKISICILSLSVSIAVAYVPQRIEPRSCQANNLYRTLERLQRESSFCNKLLSPNPTVSIPSSISATPIASFSSACTCIVGAPTTTTTTTTTSQGCTNTVTSIPDPVTVISTVTQTYTPTSTSSTSVPSAYLFDYETPSRLWGCGVKITNAPDFTYFGTCGEHQNTAEAHSGDWYLRVAWNIDHTGSYVARLGNKTPIAVLPSTKYQFSIWYRQITYSQIICTPAVLIGDQGLSNIDGTDTVNNGNGLAQLNLNTGLQWTQTTTTFTTRSSNADGVGIFLTVICTCPSSNCGNVFVGFDDMTITQTS